MSATGIGSAKRRWFRFSLRTPMLLAVAAAIPLGWLGNELTRIPFQRHIIARVIELEGKCYFDYESEVHDHGYHYEMRPPRWRAPQWLRKRFGDDALAYVRLIQFRHPYTSPKDAEIGFVNELPQLQALDADGRKVTDFDLNHIAKLGELRYLRILSPRITGKGLEALQRLKKLDVLEMHDLKVTDDALAHLCSLQSLRSLKISSWSITDEAFMHLGKIETLESLDISARYVNGKGFSNLRNLKQLKKSRFIVQKSTMKRLCICATYGIFARCGCLRAFLMRQHLGWPTCQS